MFEFTPEATDGDARAGRLVLPHGLVETPAFMREYAGEIECYTTDMGDESSWRDVTTATNIASRFGLSHVVTRASSTGEDLRRWVWRTAGETG